MLKKIIQELRTLKGVTIAVLIVVGGGLGLLSALPAVEVIHLFSTNEFCSSCHTMTPAAETFTKSVHGGNNNVGFVAQCVDCHLPDSNVVEELYVKATSGTRHMWGEFIVGMEALDYDELHPKRTEYVYDSGCVSCHQNLEKRAELATPDSSVADQTHQMAFARKDTDPDWQCSSCHYDIAHPGLKQDMRERQEQSLQNLSDFMEEKS